MIPCNSILCSGRLMALVTAVFLAAGCSAKPEEMIASAKDYLAKDDRNAAIIQLKNALQEQGDLGEARFLLGRIYFEQEDFASAVKELERARNLGYSADAVSPLLARALLKQGKHEELIETFSKVSPADPAARSVVLAALGEARLATDRERALQHYRDAIAADADNVHAALGLARAAGTDGRLEEALADVDALVSKYPEVPDVHSLRAQLLFALHRTDEGLAELKALVGLQPKHQASHYSFALVLLSLNRMEEAGAALATMRENVGMTPLTRYLQAYFDFAKGRTEAARDGLQEVLRLSPDFLPARVLAGAVFLRLNDPLQAQANLNQVLAAAPSHAGARRMLVMSYLAQRNGERAEKFLAPLLEQFPENPEILSLAGQVALITGDFEASAEYFGKVVGLKPEDATARIRLGVTQLAQGHLDEGLADLTTASGLESDKGYADFALVMALLRARDYDKALAAQQSLEKKLPDNPLTFNLKGGILLAKRDVEGARAAFEHALEVQPTFLAAATNLARLDLRDGKVGEARKRFERILEKDAKNARAHIALADLELSLNADDAVVRRHLDAAVAAAPDAPVARQRLIAFLLQTKDYKAALAAAQQLHGIAPEQPTTLRLLGEAQLAVGEHEQAIANLEKLVGQVPQRATFWLDLARAQLAAGLEDRAVESLERAASANPRHLDAQRLRVSLLVKKKAYDKALAASRQVQEELPETGAGHLLEAEVEAARENWKVAVPLFRRAHELSPNTLTVAGLLKVLMRTDKSAEATALANEWIGEHPKDLAVLTFLAEQALGAGQLEAARDFYLRLLEVNPDAAGALNNLAWVAEQLNDPAAAGYIAKALELAPDNAAILDTAGMIEVRHGRMESGVSKLERAHELAPQALGISVNLARAYQAAGKPQKAQALLDKVRKGLPKNSPERERLDELRKSL